MKNKINAIHNNGFGKDYKGKKEEKSFYSSSKQPRFIPNLSKLT
jgi:hypothetical protein